MPRGTIDWKSTESYTRLLAALVASQDLKPNYKRIADYYGEGATYDSIEGRFRIIRKEAEKLKSEIDNGTRAPAPARGTGAKSASPRKPRTPKGDSFVDIDSVLTGRVSKSANTTPSKRRTAAAKKELVNASMNSSASSGISSGATIPYTPSHGLSHSQQGQDFSFQSTQCDNSFVDLDLLDFPGPGSDMENVQGNEALWQLDDEEVA